MVVDMAMASFFLLFLFVQLLAVLPLHLQASASCPASSEPCQSFLYFSPPPGPFPKTPIARLFGIDPSLLLPFHSDLLIPQSCACFHGSRHANSTFYQVKPGDTLSHIAARYGTWVSYPQIATANLIPDPDLIFPRQRFVIPFPCACDEGLDQENPTLFVSYQARAGDTLTGIATHFNITVQELSDVDGLLPDSSIKAGAVIYAPLSNDFKPSQIVQSRDLTRRRLGD